MTPETKQRFCLFSLVDHFFLQLYTSMITAGKVCFTLLLHLLSTSTLLTFWLSCNKEWQEKQRFNWKTYREVVKFSTQLHIWVTVIPRRRQIACQFHGQWDWLQQLTLGRYLCPENHGSAHQPASHPSQSACANWCLQNLTKCRNICICWAKVANLYTGK